MDFYGLYWARLTDWFDDPVYGELKRPIALLGPSFIVVIVLGMLFCLVDMGFFPFVQRFKIQKNKVVPVDQKKLNYAIWIYFRNVIFVSSIVSAPLLKLVDLRGISFSKEIPPLRDFLLFIPAMLIIEDLWFFLCHKMFHSNKYLYEKVHKFHHQWPQPTAISVLYMHWLEYTLCIACNVFVGALVTGCHASILHLYLTFEAFKGLMNHSGYGIRWLEIPCIKGNEFHDTHHKLTNCNYGSYGFFDVLLGSYKNERNKPIKEE